MMVSISILSPKYARASFFLLRSFGMAQYFFVSRQFRDRISFALFFHNRRVSPTSKVRLSSLWSSRWRFSPSSFFFFRGRPFFSFLRFRHTAAFLKLVCKPICADSSPSLRDSFAFGHNSCLFCPGLVTAFSYFFLERVGSFLLSRSLIAPPAPVMLIVLLFSLIDAFYLRKMNALP